MTFAKSFYAYLQAEPTWVKAIDLGAVGVGILTFFSFVFDYVMPKALVLASFVWLCIQIFAWVEKRVKK